MSSPNEGYGSIDKPASNASNDMTINEIILNNASSGKYEDKLQEEEENLYSAYSENADFRYIEPSSSTVTPQQRIKQCLNAFAPVFMFLVLMGGVSFSLFKGFDVLYPGHGLDQNSDHARNQNSHINKSYQLHTDYDANNNNDNDTNNNIHDSAATAQEDWTSSASSSASSSESSNDNDKSSTLSDSPSSNCTMYSKCHELGLIGQCCPTHDGTLLSCCN